MPDQLVYRVRAVSQGWGGAPGLNTFYFLQDFGMEPSASSAAGLCVDHVQSFFEGLTALFPETWSCQVSGGVDVINTDNGDLEDTFAVAEPSAIAGAVDAGFGPQVAMLCASLSTESILDSRKIKGRAFIGPLVVGGNGDGTPSVTQAELIQDGFSDLISAGFNEEPLVVWSRRRPVSVDHPTGLGGSAHLVTTAAVQDRFAILRSRRQ